LFGTTAFGNIDSADMARLDPAPPTTQNLITRGCRWLVRRLMGREPRPYGILAHAPRAVPAITVLNALFETGHWAIDTPLRKLVHLRVAQIVGCVF
jgi:alkylhydroperoxidase family enzyme